MSTWEAVCLGGCLSGEAPSLGRLSVWKVDLRGRSGSGMDKLCLCKGEEGGVDICRQPISTYSFDEHIRKEKVDFPNDTLPSKYSALSNMKLIGIQIKFIFQLRLAYHSFSCNQFHNLGPPKNDTSHQINCFLPLQALCMREMKIA